MRTKSQGSINSCFLCSKKTHKNLLCKSCGSNPFSVEDSRTKAAKQGDEKTFKNLYSKKYPSIHNLNSQRFWNNHFHKELNLKDQDMMTKDKIKKITSFLPVKEFKLLDLGFGQGYLEEEIEKHRNDVSIHGLDISTDAVARAVKKFRGKFIHGDILRLRKTAYKRNFFDVITAIEVIEHISPENIFMFYRSVSSLLKPNGIFIISTPLNEHLKGKSVNPSGHVRDYSIEILKMELELSGFKIISFSTFYAFKKNYSLKKMLTKILRNRWEPNNIVICAKKVASN